jgi:catechol 2,3-dioxygenase-like lactoylglutathione lyase family enzyme
MFAQGEVHVNIPAADLQRARRFYVETLGLTPVAEDEQSVRFTTPSGSWFQVYETTYAGSAKHTIAQWDVADLPSTVAQFSAAGVSFEHYDMPGVTWDGDIADVGGQRVAWFTDSEGNVMCLDERPPG